MTERVRRYFVQRAIYIKERDRVRYWTGVNWRANGGLAFETMAGATAVAARWPDATVDSWLVDVEDATAIRSHLLEETNRMTAQRAAQVLERVRVMLAERATPEAIERHLSQQFGIVALQPCPGSAHENPHIDHCGICAPRWGWVEPPEQSGCSDCGQDVLPCACTPSDESD